MVRPPRVGSGRMQASTGPTISSASPRGGRGERERERVVASAAGRGGGGSRRPPPPPFFPLATEERKKNPTPASSLTLYT